MSIQEPAAAAVTIETEGLASSAAADRLKEFGANTIAQTPPRKVEMLLKKFWGTVPWISSLR